MAGNLQPITAELKVLGENPFTVPVILLNVDGVELNLSEAPNLPLGAMVKICQADQLWLGRITARKPGTLVVRATHFLDNIAELKDTAERFAVKQVHESAGSTSPTLS